MRYPSETQQVTRDLAETKRASLNREKLDKFYLQKPGGPCNGEDDRGHARAPSAVIGTEVRFHTLSWIMFLPTG